MGDIRYEALQTFSDANSLKSKTDSSWVEGS